MASIKLTNKLNQGLPILLRNGNGKMQGWVLPPRGVRVISEEEMSQDVIDKQARGYVAVDQQV